ncbi:MAG TPA: MetQ/NlpA family ABC transporter substrate-binding protein [Virgibacillus sp.]|nr:MetQ/NlpA family ABC transporter substrate-binding protein [Virgibacillus sp.]
MKKLSILFLSSLIVLLAACGESEKGAGEDSSNDGDTVISIGAQSNPHAEILEEAIPLLEDEGITLEIEEYEDYVLPNDDLEEGTIDANYFQHIPYLEQTNEETGYDLDYIGKIHIEPMGIYSKDIKSLDDIKDGTEVILSNSVADHGRILSLFEDADLIELDGDVDPVDAELDDIEKNPKNLEFTPDYEPAFLPELYESEDDVLVAINTNYAIDAGLVPEDDALILENDDSPYANVIAVRSEDKDNEALNKLVDVLHSDEIQTFIEDEYEGAIVPVQEDND